MAVPFLRPNPPRLSELLTELRGIEASGWFSNNGPVNQEFEQRVVSEMFGGSGAAITVCNATIGLMIAIKDAVENSGRTGAKYALMPSFTFAATAHAALWCGLTPRLYDIDVDTWLPSEDKELLLLDKYGDDIAVLVPYATFGNNLDLDRYERLSREHNVPVVVDAAASLGGVDGEGRGFGTGSNVPIVFSMHVTKTFSTSEAGLIYSRDTELIQRLRAMANFGFSSPREAHMPGLNAKLSEIGALLAVSKLRDINDIVLKRNRLFDTYRRLLPQVLFQRHLGQSVAHQFVPAMLPEGCLLDRDALLEEMTRRGFNLAKYFSPHVAEQPYFQACCKVSDLTNTDRISARTISFPLHDDMEETDVSKICDAFAEALDPIGART